MPKPKLKLVAKENGIEIYSRTTGKGGKRIVFNLKQGDQKNWKLKKALCYTRSAIIWFEHD